MMFGNDYIELVGIERDPAVVRRDGRDALADFLETRTSTGMPACYIVCE